MKGGERVAKHNLYTTGQVKQVLSVSNSDIKHSNSNNYYNNDISIQIAKTVLNKQLGVEGLRERTVIDYCKWF